ncbi:MAG: carboxypeptidase-like regulatory domain-containing protein [Bryobacteraceae bacterium]
MLSALLLAAVIQGVVLENQSGYPMARAQVSLDIVNDTGVSQAATQLSGRGGQFSFTAITPGTYILTAVRDGYFPASYGQRKPYGRGTPIVIEKDSNFFTELRLLRMGAITGRILDANRVGLMNVSVVAYPATAPLRPDRTVKSDDRGVYRIWGLRPGKYWVRSITAQPAGMSLLPTFPPEAIELRDTKILDVRLDSEVPDVNITPLEGRLLTLNGSVTCPSQLPMPVHVTIASDTGRQDANTVCNGGYQFTGLAPGYYEIYAEAGISRTGSEYSVYTDILVDSDRANGTLELKRTPEVSAEVRLPGSEGLLRNVPVELVLRRADLAGVLGSKTLNVNRGYLDFRLDPGNYELHANPPGDYWVVDVRNAFGRSRRRQQQFVRHPDWFDAFVEAAQAVHFQVTLQKGAAKLRGVVTQEGKPVGGVPVFLWPEKDETRRSARGPRETRTNAKGEYRFESLPPGPYRVLASFDFDEVDQETMDSARAPSVTLKQSDTSELNLAPYIAP